MTLRTETSGVFAGFGFLARASFRRSWLSGADGTRSVPQRRLRVLMLISRPAGTGDIRYRMVTRPLLRRLDGVRGEADLVVLRPPTLDALGRLSGGGGSGKAFQVAHFDGHGALPSRSAGGGSGDGRPAMMDGPAPEGVLVFERPSGGSDRSRAQWYVMLIFCKLLPRFGSTVPAAETAATPLTLTPGAPFSVAVTAHRVPCASLDSVHTRPAA